MRQVVSGESITTELAMADALILSLCLVEGVSLTGFRERFGVEAMDAFGDRLGEPLDNGLLEIVAGRLRLTDRGRLRGNEVFARLPPED